MQGEEMAGTTLSPDQSQVVYETETIKVPSRECRPGTENKCFEYKVPDYQLVSTPHWFKFARDHRSPNP